MKVDLSKVFPVEGSADAAWASLQDIEGVAGCMPGAEISEKIDDHHYKGQVKVKLGPVSAVFNGDIEVKGVDADKREIQLLAKGSDSKGSSAASMDLTASIRGDSAPCELSGDAEVTVNGKLANFGGRMMTQVADHMLKQFAANFSDKVKASSPSDTAAAVASEPEQQTEKPQELNGLKLIWNVVLGFVKSVFGKTGASRSG